MSALIRISSSEEETERIAFQLGQRLVPGTVVALEGDLGVGKTRFVRGLARGLGLDPEAIASPTFVLEHRHEAPGAIALVHIDAYRIRSAEDLASLGWEELLSDANAVVAVEWASRIAPALPPARIEVHLRHRGEEHREIEIEEVRPLAAATTCPVCGTPLPADASGRFCSPRCRMSDLGRWFRGDYRIGRAIEEDDLGGGEPDAWEVRRGGE